MLTGSIVIWIESEPGAVDIVLARLKALEFIFRYSYFNVLAKDTLSWHKTLVVLFRSITFSTVSQQDQAAKTYRCYFDQHSKAYERMLRCVIFIITLIFV